MKRPVAGAPSGVTPPSHFLPAYKHGWPRLAIDAMIRGRLRSGLFAIRVQGLDELRRGLDAEPGGTLFLANHSCWWDLFLVHLLNRSIPVDGYGMMEHANLKRFGFFRRIGAYSVDRTSLGGLRASLDYTARLLEGPRAGVWVFPQGTIRGNDVRPLDFRPGLRAIIERSGRVRVVAVAFRYEFWQDERPEAFVRFGSAAWVGREQADDAPATWERNLTAELDALRADVVAQRADRFATLLEGTRSISERYARFRERLRGGPG